VQRKGKYSQKFKAIAFMKKREKDSFLVSMLRNTNQRTGDNLLHAKMIRKLSPQKFEVLQHLFVEGENKSMIILI